MGYTLRRFLSEHRWVYWAIVIATATVAAWSVHGTVDHAEQARRSWTATQIVLVAAHDHDAGDVIGHDAIELPVAAVPATAVHQLDSDAIARQSIAAGEVLTDVDVAGATTGVAPDGTLTIAIRAYDTTIATMGDHVHVLAEGRSVSDAGVVVDVVDDIVHVAVPERDAPAVAAAASSSTATLAIAP